MALARDQGLSVYDACYLDVALRERLALVTLDTALSAAAGRLGVPLYGG
jgi:predicted nucleic acid-binding protein